MTDEESEFQNLRTMETKDLVLLLSAYVKEPCFLEKDKMFLAAIQKELRERKC